MRRKNLTGVKMKEATARTGVTWRHPFEVKWAIRNRAVQGGGQFAPPFRAISRVIATLLQQRISEQEMTSEFRNELVALLPRLRRFALTLAGDLEHADDLVQQACERALQKQDQWQSDTRLDSWMYRILQNLHIDHLRTQRRRSQNLHSGFVEELEDARSAGQPESENMLNVLSGLIHELPEEQRAVMLLVAVEEYSYREAAEILKIPLGTVMSRLARARAKLITMLDDPALSAKRGTGNA